MFAAWFLCDYLFPMIIRSWNIIELGNGATRSGVKDFCVLNRVDVLCLEESKLCQINSGILRSLGGG